MKVVFSWLQNISAALGILSFFGIGLGVVQNHILSEKFESLSAQIENEKQGDNSLIALKEYLILLERGDADNAWNMLTPNMQASSGTYQGFSKWISQLVALEGLAIERIDEKSSASSVTYLISFDWKARGMKPIPTKWGLTMQFTDQGWKVNSNSVLFEKDWKQNACDFYSKLKPC